MDIFVAAVVAFLGLAIGLGLLGFVLHKKGLAKAFDNAQKDSKRILEEARKEADRLVKNALREAKEENRHRRNSFEEETKQRRTEIAKLESKIKAREQTLEKKLAILEKREKDLSTLEGKLQQDDQKYKRLLEECESTLERSRKTLQAIANMSAEEAKRELILSLESDARKKAQETIRRIEADARREADEKARAIISTAVQRISSEYVNDSTISVVALPSEDMKGRIIGREGRNIRAIEHATGIDLIIDDTPEAVIISSFNPIRREVAKVALERLIADGRIHPARIEETVKRVETEFDQVIQENGERASFDTGITDLHPELIKLLGRLKYRSTGQQTVLNHAVEVSHLCGIIAGEIGLNVKKAKRIGILHDIGKAVDQEIEGHHATVGADLCAKYDEAVEVVDAIRLHHTENLTYATSYAVVLQAANVLSANRPGARKEMLETYVKRLTDMEKIITSFDGIEGTFVLQAGREVLALVSPTNISDEEVVNLSNEIATKLRNELTFPGQVRVTVVKETKFTEYAR